VNPLEVQLVQMIVQGLLGCKKCADAWDALKDALQHATTPHVSVANGDGE
jgi:hypothetical protein